MFVNNGRTGTSRPHYAGGNGAQGNQAVGEIDQQAPTLDGREPAVVQEEGQKPRQVPAKAWAVAGTWRATVTRSYTGVNAGDNGDWYLTAAAAARSNAHEVDHINATQACHDTHIAPLEQRTRRHETEPNARVGGNTRAESIQQLAAFVDWDPTITRFRDCDRAANGAGGTVDANYRPSRDLGPRVVNGKQYQHYVDAP